MKITNPKPKIHLFHYNHRTQQTSPTDHFDTKRSSQHKKQIVVPPINKKSTQQNFNPGTKPLRSLRQSKQIHRHQNNFKAPIFDINVLKNSLTGKKEGQENDLKKSERVKKQVPISTRIFTENKIHNTEGSDHSKQKQFDKSKQKTKPSFRTNIKTKSLQKTEGVKNKKPDYAINEKIILFSKNQKYQSENKNFQKDLSNPTSRRSIQKYQKKLSSYEREQITKFQDVYFIGPRRIYSKSDFTDGQGDPKVMLNDGIAYRYEIISSLGHGSFGKVFKAFDHKKKQYIALKIIKSQKKFFEQAKVEVQILQCALFKDPKLKSNVVRMKGSFVFRNHSCITFEILHKNLYQFLKEHHFSGFSLDLIRRFAIQLLQSLMFFRKNHIIHCDLKPQNILLKQQNKSGIRVIDVGSGCFEAKQIYTYIQSRFYRAPQIILGIKYTPAIDMWSFGCILVELFTGFPIFPGDSENEQLLMFMQVLDAPPKAMLKKAERRKKFFNDSLECKIPQEKGKQRIINSIKLQQVVGSKDTSFTDIISRCFEWDPQKRITPEEALLHEWILKGLPEQIRQQHITQLSNLFYH